MKQFTDVLAQHPWDSVQAGVASATSADVERALAKQGQLEFADFQALISRAAAPYLETMARKARELTLRRFGRTTGLYIPIYLSNECTNMCTYCGFSMENKITRRTLNDEEILKEIHAVKPWGYEHVLLVTGESVAHVDMDYFRHVVQLVRPYFAQISLEVQPLDEENYRELIGLGVTSVLVYQETYCRESYAQHHPKGKKRVFDYRVLTPDRLGRAGMRKIGLGCLIGLEDWRTDSCFVALHLRHLEQQYWRSRFSVSFPRLRPHVGRQEPKVVQSDRELVQLICAWRIFDPDIDLALSTRESARFRDGMMGIGITHMSAGSRTDPGGYASAGEELEQFAINDDRDPVAVAESLRQHGLEPVWKDWDAVLEGAN